MKSYRRRKSTKPPKITIEYNGKWPNLCSGQLFVIVEGKRWDFGRCCLISGGRVYKDDEGDWHTHHDSWSIDEWPEDFPSHLEHDITEAVNEQITHGCCGGCI